MALSISVVLLATLLLSDPFIAGCVGSFVSFPCNLQRISPSPFATVGVLSGVVVLSAWTGSVQNDGSIRGECWFG